MDHIYIDIRTCELTLSEVMEVVHRLIAEHPESDVYFDGDAYAIRVVNKERP